MSTDTDHLLTEFTPTREVVLAWLGIGTGGMLVATFLFGAIYAASTGQSSFAFGVGDVDSIALATVLTIALFAGVIVLHELVHAAVIRYYGGDVSFGVGVAQFVMPYAYVTTTRRLRRNEFVLVALAPLVVISLVGAPVMVLLDAPILVLPLALNAAGAIGDLWMVGILGRYPSHVVVEDSEDGLRVYGRESDAPVPPTRARAILVRTAMGAGVGFGALLFLAIAAPVALAIVGVDAVALGVPDSPWLVLAFETTPDGGFESTVSPLGVFAVSLLLGFVYALATTTLAAEPASTSPESTER